MSPPRQETLRSTKSLAHLTVSTPSFETLHWKSNVAAPRVSRRHFVDLPAWASFSLKTQQSTSGRAIVTYPVLDSETVGGTSNDQQHHGGYGGSYLAFVYYQPPIKPLVPRWSKSAEDPPGHRRSLFSLDQSSQRCLSQAAWDRSSEAMVVVGALLLRACASWWWLRAPLKMTGFLLAACAAWSALGYLFGLSAVVAQVRVASGFLNANRLLTCIDWQVHMVIVTDFLRCIEWEAQRRAVDMGVMMMERAYGLSRMSVNTHR
ncbi:hypothetical protein HD554DRAFT_671011 [Boletus coccyginus]|nr:hypothetical protein HD554DRAFT_671011 [Boletus coccyginus]